MQAAHSITMTRGAGLPSFVQKTNLLRRPLRVASVPPARITVCKAQKDEQSVAQRAAASLSAALAISLLLSAGTPDAALAARSGGRVGGSAFRSSAPSRSYSSGPSVRSSPSPGPAVRNYNYYNTAPPVYAGGYGYGGGMSFMPSFLFPVYGFGGGIFTFLFAMFVFSTVISAVRNSFSRRDSDDFED